MIKSMATKIRIANKKEAAYRFDRSTSEGREGYKEFLRGLLVQPKKSRKK